MSGNAGASVWDLLRQRAKQTGADVQSLATSYAIERFMVRLMEADTDGNVTVKGGQSLGILFGNQMRPTKDLDINVGLEGIDDPEEWASRLIQAACADQRDDGLSVDTGKISFEHREHQGEGGLRVTVPSAIHTCRTTFVIDVGVGNEITFEPSKIKVAGVLAGHRAAPPALDARIYPHENTLAEKLVAKIEDGLASIRHKDFFDIWLSVEILRRIGDLRFLVAKENELSDHERTLVAEAKQRLADGTLLDMEQTAISDECIERLGLALFRTARHRECPLPDDIQTWLMDEFGNDAHHSAQWANWCRNQKGRLLFQPPGTGKDDDRHVALGVLLSDIGPLLGEIGQRATTYEPMAVPGM